MKIVFDAQGEVLGRLGSLAAKELLKGNSVDIINSEKAIISGNRRFIVEKIKRLRRMGGSSQKGPKISKTSERLLKRMIRGMLPWDRQKGRDAWKRLKCYAGNPEGIKDAKKLNFKKPFKFVTLEEVTRLL